MPTTVLVTVFCAIQPAVAQDTAAPLTIKEVVQEVLIHHPDLTVSAYDAAIAATDQDRVAAQLESSVNASVGLSDDRQPTVSDFQPAETRLGQASASLSKPLASGATLSLGADYSRTRQGFDSPFAAQLAKINPAYRGGLSLSYRYPLLQGSDRPAYTAGLEAARADTAAAERQREVVARGLSQRAIDLYYTLLSDYVSVALAQSGVERAQKFVDYQQLRERYGMIEEADRLQAEALLATRRFDLQTAHARQRSDEAELNRLMLRPADAPLQVVPASRPARDASVDEAFKGALERRPEFRIIDAQLAAAEARLRMAADTDRSRVDVIAELGTQSLEADAIDGVTGVFQTSDRFAGISLEFTDTLGRGAARAERRRAEFTRGRVLAQRRQLEEQVRDELVTAHTTLVTGERTLRAARTRVAAEREKFDAELQRYRDGRSSTATVIQFENDLSTAELQAEMQQLTLSLAGWRFAWSAGTLREELGVILPPAAEPAP